MFGGIMKRALQFGLFFLLAAALLAQNPPRNYGSRTGFGNVVFPGMGNPPPLTPNPFTNPNSMFAERLGATISGFPPYTGAPIGGSRGRRSVVIPYAYPVFVGGYGYGYGYGYDPQPQQQAPTVIYAYPPQPQQAPQVIINQNFLTPGAQPQTGAEPESGMSLYQAPSRAPAEPATTSTGSKAPVFLIAYKDHSVYSAVAYWVEGDMLHYITTDGKHNQASLALIDRKMSEDLNKERDVDFRLPK